MHEDIEKGNSNIKMDVNFVICDAYCDNVTEIVLLKPPDPNKTLLERELERGNETQIHFPYNISDTLNHLYYRTTQETLSNCTFKNGTCTEVYNYEYLALSLLVFPVLTLFGNVLVILSVAKERSLQSATNYFIVSLAVADLLVAVVVMPFGVYYLFNKMVWKLPATVCDCYIAMDVTCSTSSIFNLVAISVDRYIAVTQPIKYARPKGKARVWTMIGVAWLVSAAIGSPIVLGLNNTPDRKLNECLFNNTDYVIYSSLGSFFIPCIIMMFLYFNIFKVIHKRVANKHRSTKKPGIAQALAPSSGAAAVVFENVAQTQRGTDGVQDDNPTNTGSGSNKDEDESIMANIASPIPMVDTNNDSGYVTSNVDIAMKEMSPLPSPIKEENKEDKIEEQKNGSPEKPELRKKLSRITLTVNMPKQPRQRFKTVASAVTMFRTNIRINKIAATKEKKATQTLAIVLGVFLFCWAPFFTCNVLDAICQKLKVDYKPDFDVFAFTTWLGYINSFLNPVIYTIFNPEFRKAFRRILRCGT